jgi:hypothetical protein
LQLREMSDSVAVSMIKVTDQIREAARRLLVSDMAHHNRMALERVASGERKRIDAIWWRDIHGVVNRMKLDKIARLADPNRNSNENERAAAAGKLAELKKRRPPGLRPPPPPLPTLEEMIAARRGRRKRHAARQEPPKTGAMPQPAIFDSVARKHALNALNARRAAKRAAMRVDLTCQRCGKPLLTAQRVTARYCGPTCRSQAWRCS